MSFDRREGRRHALDVLRSVLGMPKCCVELRDALANLRATAERLPEEYRRGVLEIVEAAEGLE